VKKNPSYSEMSEGIILIRSGVNILYVIFPSPKGPVTMFHCLKALTISQESSIENGMDQPNCNYNWKESTNGRLMRVIPEMSRITKLDIHMIIFQKCSTSTF
jgi:hypothetical protein